MRKITLLLTLGLFLSATAANACDGDKAATKGKKASTCTDAKCMKNGKCTMTAAAMKKAGCCSSATASATGKANCDAKAAASGTHKCCKAKTEGSNKS